VTDRKQAVAEIDDRTGMVGNERNDLPERGRSGAVRDLDDRVVVEDRADASRRICD
jgi:hypothetical protein